MPRFDLLDEVTSVYMPNGGGQAPALPKFRSKRVGRISFATALVVVLAAVVGF